VRELQLDALDRLVVGEQEVAGHDFLQLRDGADVAGGELIGLLVLFPLQDEEVPDAFLAVRARVDERRVGGHRSRQDSKDVDATREGIGDRLEDERSGAVRRHLDRHGLLGG
jgi:hypothetical protein